MVTTKPPSPPNSDSPAPGSWGWEGDREVTGRGESDDLLSSAPPSPSRLAPFLLWGRSGSSPPPQCTGAPAVCLGVRSVLLQPQCLAHSHWTKACDGQVHEDTARVTWELLKHANAEPALTSATAESLKAGVVGGFINCIHASQVTAGKRRKQGQDSLVAWHVA